MKTIKEYKKAILKKYEEGQIEYLSQLSPAKIRQDCLLKFQNGLNKNDLIQFICFFGLEEGSNYLKNIRKIESFDIDKFRPFKNFLNRVTEDTLDKNVELIAILTNFEPRPFNKYRKQDLKEGPVIPVKKASEYDEKIFDSGLLRKKVGKKSKILKNACSESITRGQIKITESLFSSKKFLFALGMFLAIYVLMITAKYLFASKVSTDKDDMRYMIWTGDSYKKAPYDILKSSANFNKIALFEESKMMNFKKISVTKSYPFFSEDDEPNLWYNKMGKHDIEFFSAPGKHPITGKTLKAITPYIIKKYIAAV